jgi:eukaryotic-like serine/threonine-protein kinase
VSVLGGRYELGPSLGSGGMATVVAGHDRVLDRPVAVKLLGRQADPEARARLLREARAAARLHHPNAVAVYDTGEHDGQPFIVMELVRGRTLADELRDRERLAVEETVAVGLGILDALAAAHANGIVHRDVKPGNVLLPDAGGVKLGDFGIAKALEDVSAALTATGTVLGTPTYLAPELVHGATAVPASDVYSVGCLLFECLTGRPPFTGDSAVAVAYAHVHRPVPDVRTLRPEVPSDLAAVVATAMHKDPAERYADAAALRAALLEGPTAVPTRTAVLPPPAPGATQPVAATTPVATPGPATSGDASSGPRWWLLALVALAGLVGVWLVVDAADRGTPPGDDGDVGPGRGALDEPPPADPPPAEGETDAADGAGEALPDAGDAPGAPDADGPAAPGEPGTLDELIVLLAGSPMGTYGEKHADLLEDLIDLREEDAPGQRAKKAGELQAEVVGYVADGELDPDVGRVAIDVIGREAARRGD